MKNDDKNRNPKPDQYKRDWAYAARALDKGELPAKVVKDIASFRKDLPDPQKYAETTVAKVREHLDVQAELKAENKSQDKTPGAIELKRMFKQVSDLEFARHLYEDGKDKNAVIEALHDKKAAPDYALVTATEAELRRFAERDLDYATGAQITDDQIAGVLYVLTYSERQRFSCISATGFYFTRGFRVDSVKRRVVLDFA